MFVRLFVCVRGYPQHVIADACESLLQNLKGSTKLKETTRKGKLQVMPYIHRVFRNIKNERAVT